MPSNTWLWGVLGQMFGKRLNTLEEWTGERESEIERYPIWFRSLSVDNQAPPCDSEERRNKTSERAGVSLTVGWLVYWPPVLNRTYILEITWHKVGRLFCQFLSIYSTKLNIIVFTADYLFFTLSDRAMLLRRRRNGWTTTVGPHLANSHWSSHDGNKPVGTWPQRYLRYCWVISSSDH